MCVHVCVRERELKLATDSRYAVVFSDERWRFKIPRDKVMSEQLEFELSAASSAYDLVQETDTLLGRCRINVSGVQGVVASFPERSKEQRLRLNLERHVEQLMEAGQAVSKLSRASKVGGEEDFDRRPIMQVLCSYGYLVSPGSDAAQEQKVKAVREGVPPATKNKSKEAREAKEQSAKFVSEVALGDHTGGGAVTKGKSPGGIKNLPGAAHESHWVDVTVLSVRHRETERQSDRETERRTQTEIQTRRWSRTQTHTHARTHTAHTAHTHTHTQTQKRKAVKS